MNAIDYALQRIFNEVPRELLSDAFSTFSYFGYRDSRELPDVIEDDVIHNKVMLDLNRLGGEQVQLPLDQMHARTIHDGVIFEIPTHLTQGRKIVSVYSLDYYLGHNSLGAGQYASGSNSALKRDGMRMMNAASGPTSVGTSRIRLIAPNTIFTPETSVTGYRTLRCLLENDGQLANIAPSAHIVFGDMVVYACKSLVYNRINIRLGEGSIQPGSINGYLRGALDDFADAEEMYRELRSGRWQKIAVFNDDLTRQQLTRTTL